MVSVPGLLPGARIALSLIVTARLIVPLPPSFAPPLTVTVPPPALRLPLTSSVPWETMVVPP